MKTPYLALILLGGCLNEDNNYFINRNTSTTSSTALLESETSRILYSGFYLSRSAQTGERELRVASSATPFLCDSEGVYDIDNHFEISTKIAQGFAPGEVLPLTEFAVFLAREDFPSSFVASISAPENDNIIGEIEIQELTETSFSGKITLQIPGEQAHFELAPIKEVPDTITFTLNIVGAPVCTIFTY